ncbi:hypothetical protein Tco_0421584 [Tanacetum coccineum]
MINVECKIRINPLRLWHKECQGEGNDVEMTKAQQGNENLETTQEQVVEDAHVTISTIPKKRQKILPQILPSECLTSLPPLIEKLINESRDESYSSKGRGRKDNDNDKNPSTDQTEFKEDERRAKMLRPTTGPEKERFYLTSTMPKQDQAGNLGDNEDEPRDETASRRDWFKKPTPPHVNVYKALSEIALKGKILEGGDYPFDLFKNPFLVPPCKLQKYHSNSSSTMISSIEDVVPNIWCPVKVAFDKGYVYSTKRILAVTHVSVMRKHGYGYLEEIVVRRANNVPYRFKEGDFSRLRINDIEDMLILNEF